MGSYERRAADALAPHFSHTPLARPTFKREAAKPPLAPAFKRVSAKRAVAVVNDSPVGCQSRDWIRLSELSKISDF